MKKFFILAMALLLVSCTTTTAPQAKTSAKPKSEREIIISYAVQHGIPRNVIEHVARKESGFRCKPGNPRYHGPLQINPGSARALGYTKGEGSLNSCQAGLKYGVRHLKLCVNKVGANAKKAATCHASPGRFGVHLRWK